MNLPIRVERVLADSRPPTSYSLLLTAVNWLGCAAIMLDAQKIRFELDVAIERFAARIADSFAEALKSLSVGDAPAAPAKKPVSRKKAVSRKKSAPAPAVPKRAPAGPAAKPAPSTVRPLLNRPNVHRIPSGARPSAPSVVMSSTSLLSKGPAPEEIAERAVRMVAAASLPPTLERIRLALKVTRDALVPVVDRLVQDNRLRVVDVGGVILYKPPRVEPIRRKAVRRVKEATPT